MPIQKVEYEFPDPDKIEAAAEVEVNTPEETADIEVEGAVGREVMQKPKKEPAIKSAPAVRSGTMSIKSKLSVFV